jgi:hypothetical protein
MIKGDRFIPGPDDWPFGICVYPADQHVHLREYRQHGLHALDYGRQVALLASVPRPYTDLDAAVDLWEEADGRLQAVYTENREREAGLLTDGTAARLAALARIRLLISEVEAGVAEVAALGGSLRCP